MTFITSETYSSFEKFSTSSGEWDLEFIQLSPGSFNADLLYFGDNDLQISEVCYNKLLQQHGSAPDGYYTFAVHHLTSAPIRWRYLDFPTDAIIIFPENNELLTQEMKVAKANIIKW